MLEHLPAWLGELLKGVRAGPDKLAIARVGQGAERLSLSSPAFADGGRLPERFTADGPGVSPPLVWGALPEGVQSLALIVEDPDAPLPEPLAHAVVWGIPADTQHLPEGAIRRDGDGDAHGDVGRNSFRREGWLPPDPPTGHGEHAYVFQLLALGETPKLPANPNRGDVLRAVAGHVLAAGVLTGTYSRGAVTKGPGGGRLAEA